MARKKNKSQNNIKIETKPIKFIKPINHALLIISSLAISVILIISWALAISLYRNNINNFLISVSEQLKNKGYDYTISFSDFTIASLVFAILALITAAIPFIFLHKKNFISLLITIFSLLYALIILLALGTIIYICFDSLKTFITTNSTTIILLSLLPWGLEAFFAIILLLSALWLLITFLHRPKERSNQTIKLTTVETSNAQDAIISTPQLQQPTPLFFNPQGQSMQPQAPIIINNQISDKPKISTSAEESEKPVLPEIKIYINNSDKTSEMVISKPEKDSRKSATRHATSVPLEQMPLKEPIVWKPEEIESIWNKSEIITGFDAKLYRKDYAGALMFRKAFVNHPNEESENNPKSYNWTIVLQKPLSHGGTIEDYNLLAMNTMNYLKKGNDYPKWKTIITYNGRENVIKEKEWKDK